MSLSLDQERSRCKITRSLCKMSPTVIETVHPKTERDRRLPSRNKELNTI
uniref:Uncharacterized protein n=1 Tax=Hyaloperonospora arabidopsidis (strain Emoy2) TaxID=559515 RepID=M4BT56_HYAAE